MSAQTTGLKWLRPCALGLVLVLLAPPPAARSEDPTERQGKGEFGALIGQFGALKLKLASPPLLVLRSEDGKRRSAPVRWFPGGRFAVDLPAGTYVLESLVVPTSALGPRTTAEPGALSRVDVGMEFQVRAGSLQNAGLLALVGRGRDDGQCWVVRVDNSVSVERDLFGDPRRKASKRPDLIPGRVLAPGVFGRMNDDMFSRPDRELGQPITPEKLDRGVLAEFREAMRIRDRSVSPSDVDTFRSRICSRWAGFCYTDDQDYTPRWDWKDRSGYTNFYGVPLVAPWDADSHLGLEVTNYLHPTNQGWRLYERRLSCEDRGQDCTGYNSTNVNDGPMPYFALYNIHTGILRSFFYVNSENYVGSQRLLASVAVVREGGAGAPSDYGTLLLQNERGLSLSDAPGSEPEPVVHIAPAIFGKWVVIDKELTYVPDEPISDGLLIRYELSTVATTALNVGGDLELSKETVIPEQKSGLALLWDSRESVREAYNKPNDLIEELEKRGDSLASGAGWKASVGSAMLSVAELLSPFSGYLGAFNAGYSIFKSLTSSSSGGSNIELWEGSVTLSGDLVQSAPLDVLEFGVHRSHHDDSLNESELDFDGRLGLFGIARGPRIRSYLDGFRVEPIAARDLVRVNPAANMNLVDAKVSIIVHLNQYVAAPDTVGRFEHLHDAIIDGEAAGGVDYKWETMFDTVTLDDMGGYFPGTALGFELFAIGDHQESSTWAGGWSPAWDTIPARAQIVRWRDPDLRVRAVSHPSTDCGDAWMDWNPKIFWFPEERSVGYTWQNALDHRQVPMVGEAYAQFQLRFTHKDDLTIRFQTVRTVPLTVERIACTRVAHPKDPPWDPHPPPVCSAEALGWD